jgi:hypothetical protein
MKRPRSNVTTVIASRKRTTVMVRLNAKTTLMRVIRDAVSRSSHSTTIKDVDVLTLKLPVSMVIVSPQRMPVTAKPNVVMDLMKVTRNVASRNTPSMTIRDVAATQKPSGLVPTVTVSPMLDTVTVKNFSAKIDLMKVNTIAASRNTLTTTSKFVAATQTLNSPVTMVNVSQKLADVMVKPNAKMDLMKVTNNVASTSSPSMMMLDVVVKRTNSNVPIRNVSAKPISVMVKLNAPMVLMNLTTTVALRTTNSTTTRNVAANQDLNTLALMATVFP